MNQIFHKDSIFNDANKAWKRYKETPDYFRFPERITVELTNRCNLQCFMCPRNKVRMQLGNMDLALFKKIIDEASLFLPICLVPFFRGESLLHPQFLKMLSYAKKKGLKPIQLATNIYFLNLNLAKGILDLDVDFISFSIDVNNPQVYKKIRRNSNYEKVFKNITFFLGEKKRRNKLLPEVQVSAVKTEQNTDLMDDFISFWRNKVDRVRVYYAHSLDGKLGHLNQEDETAERKPCLKLLTDIVIYWNGDVAVCNHDWERQEFMGNVKNDSIETIWKNENYKRIRQRQMERRYSEDPTCKHCDHWEVYYREEQLIGEIYSSR